MLKDMSLKLRMLLYIGGMVFLSFAITIGIVSMRVGTMAIEDADQLLMAKAAMYSNIVDKELDSLMVVTRNLAHVFEGLKDSIPAPKRETLDAILQKTLQGNKNIISVWSCWEPNALDNLDATFANSSDSDTTGRYLSSFSNDGKAILKNYDQSGKGDYYLIAKNSGKEVATEPYPAKIQGKETVITTLAVPIFHKNKIVGVVGVNVDTHIFNWLADEEILEGGYLSFFAPSGNHLVHPSAKWVGRLIQELDWGVDLMAHNVRGERYVAKNFAPSIAADVGRYAQPFTVGNASGYWSVMANVPIPQILARANTLKYICIGVGVIALAISLLVIIYMINNVTANLKKVVDFAGNMATGDLGNHLDIDQEDEIGQLAKSLNNMTKNLAAMMQKITDGVTTLKASSGDLAYISEEMSTSAMQTSEKSTTVARSSEDMTSSMLTASAAMEQASTSVSTVASTSEEMSATVTEIASNAARARGVTEEALDKSSQAANRMEELGCAAQEISKVTEAITEISEQTNLLALNATIEAARAGESGKGFAVVANEIKELARQTALASADIKEKVTNIQHSTTDTVAEITEINTVIDNVNDIVTTIASAVEEQSVSSDEIAKNISQVAGGISEVNENVAQNSNASVEISREIGDISYVSDQLRDNSSKVNMQSSELQDLAEQLGVVSAQFKV